MSNARFKVWTRRNRGTSFPTLAAAQRAADAVFQQTGVILLITEQRTPKRRKRRA